MQIGSGSGVGSGVTPMFVRRRGGTLDDMEPTTNTLRHSLDKQLLNPEPNPESASESISELATEPASAAPSDPFGPVAPARREFRLHRSRTDRMLGGVLGGLAESLGVDAALLRIGLIALTLLGAGIGVVLYLAAWILVPEADA